MFKIDKYPKIWATASVAMPDEEVQTFKVHFNVLSVDDFAEYDMAKPDHVSSFLRYAIISYDEIDTDGADLKTGEISDALIQNPITRMSLLRAYHDTIAEAARGN